MPLSFSPTSSTFSQPLNLSRLAAGNHTLTVTARDAAGLETTQSVPFTLAAAVPLTVSSHTPLSGASDVGSTFRPQVFFSRPIDPGTLNANNFFATDTTGTKVPATIVPAQDGSFAWLFFTNPLPGGSTIRVHAIGETILAADGTKLDADADGAPGGELIYRFTTVSLAPLLGTSLSGRMVDPGDDLKPMTFDDIRAGADGVLYTPDDVFLNPIKNAKVFLLGMEDQFVFTDDNGFFSFDSVPGGTIKLAIDGRTASNPPTGVFWPEMVMDLEMEIGRANTVMGTMGTRAEREAHLERTEVYLPRFQTSILHDVDATQTTMVKVDAVSAPNLTPQQRQQLTIEIQPGSLIGVDGQPLASGQVGISTVPPELVRDMLPPGLMQHTFDITVQAPGISNFATPAPMTFPNVFNAAPGTQLNFLSFDHTTGRLVIEGTATVSVDGMTVTTDPDTGITHPGWHGVTPAGSPTGGNPGEPCPSPNDGAALGRAAAVEAGIASYELAADIAGAYDKVKNLGEIATEVRVPGVPVLDFINQLDNGKKIAQSFINAYNTPADSFPGLGLKAAYVFEGLGRVSQAFLGALVNLPGLRELKPLSFALGVAQDLADKYAYGEENHEHLANAGRFMQAAVESPACEPSRQPAARQAVDTTVDSIDRLGQRAAEQAPQFAEAQQLSSNIADIIQRADKSQPDLGYTPTDMADLARQVERYGEIIEDIQNSGPFWEEVTVITNSLPNFTQAYTEPPRTQPSGSGMNRIEAIAPKIPLYWSAEIGSTVLRGRVSGSNRIEFFAAPNQLVRVSVYDPMRNKLGIAVTITKQSGLATNLGNIPMLSVAGLPDTDGEGLVDAAEFVIGTSATQQDTDADGINDFIEVQQGLDPLSGKTFATGMTNSHHRCPGGASRSLRRNRVCRRRSRITRDRPSLRRGTSTIVFGGRKYRRLGSRRRDIVLDRQWESPTRHRYWYRQHGGSWFPQYVRFRQTVCRRGRCLCCRRSFLSLATRTASPSARGLRLWLAAPVDCMWSINFLSATTTDRSN